MRMNLIDREWNTWTMVVAGGLFLLAAAACNRGERNDDKPTEESAAGRQSGPIALPASYEGVLPCADCAGIRYIVDLRDNKMFVLRMTYLGKGEGEGTSFEDIGKWSLGPDSRTITLRSDSESSVPLHFAIVSPQTLRKLDTEGKEIRSEANHDLTRTEPYQPLIAEAAAETPGGTVLSLENMTWNLAELDGAPIQPTGQRVPYLRLDGGQKRASGFAGCNRMSGEYQLDGEKVRFPALISTKMACPDLELENGFMIALNVTTGWRIMDSKLELLGAEGQVLARFTPAPGE
jgi:heat shock protein HslJ